MSKTYYITTPIYYVNDKPHIGHAYTSIAADVLARFKRMDGYDVHFLTGVDEHGQKVEKSAQKLGMDAQAFVDSIAQTFKEMGKRINLSNDDFIRTTEKRHVEACKIFWGTLEKSGHIYEGKYTGWYATRDEAFYSEEETYLNEQNVRISKTTGAEVHWAEEDTYFFRLSSFQDKLLALYAENPHFIRPKGRYNEVVSYVKRGLKDLSVSRTSFTWGVPVPNHEKHVMYVWLDALTNYISALGYPTMDKGLGLFWPADMHMVGKDIVIFHAVYWPAFLMAAQVPLPKCVFAHGWWTNKGEKISKSLGNTIDVNELIDLYGLDQIRYFLLREVPFGQDGDFSTEALVKRINGDLADDLGNLYQRTLSFVHKHFEGKIPPIKNKQPQDEALEEMMKNLLPQVRTYIDQQDFYNALGKIWENIRALNAYIDKEAPWGKKDNKERMGTIVATALNSLKRVAYILHPWMPAQTQEALRQLGVEEHTLHFATYTELLEGRQCPLPVPIFKKYEV